MLFGFIKLSKAVNKKYLIKIKQGFLIYLNYYIAI